MIQTPAFRNINIFFLIQTYGSYIYTVQKIILRPAGPRFITAMTGGGRWLQEGTQGEERGGQRGTLFFFLPSLFLLGGWIYTHLTGGRRSVHCFFFRYRPFHSAPNTRPLASFILSHFHWMHAHTHSITPFSLSLSPFHSRTFFPSFFLTHLLCLTLPIFFLSSFFFPFQSFTLARSCLSCSHIQQHLNIVFSVIIKRNNDNI